MGDVPLPREPRRLEVKLAKRLGLVVLLLALAALGVVAALHGDAGPPISETLSEAEAAPFKRLHPKLRVSPINCRSDEITYCEGMVRVSCGAGDDAPVHYYDNASAELLGTCGFWVRDRNCMPQRWKVCAVQGGVPHISEEPDPSFEH